MRLLLLLLPIGFFGAFPLQAQFQFNEVMTWNTATEAGQGYSDFPDWIEIVNITEREASLRGWSVSDSYEFPQKWTFTQEQRVASAGFLTVFADGFDHALHTNFSLRSEGEWLGLFRPDGSLADSLTLPALPRNVSLGREIETGFWQWFDQPTPGAANDSPARQGLSPRPQFSHPGGRYPAALSLTLSHPHPAALIRYTLDGREPDTNSQMYQGPFRVSTTQIIKARAWVENLLPSEAETHTLFINEPIKDLPIFSLSTPPANLWDNQIGIYVTGTNGIKGNGPNTDPPRNWNQDWERPVFLEYYDEAGQPQLRQEAGIKIYGGWSRGHAQKSLSVFARKEYGSNTFAYPFFPERPFTEYESIVLRNSGNDWIGSGGVMFRDGFQQRLALGWMDIDRVAYRPSVLFLNGNYWGIHNIREKQNEAYLNAHYQFDKTELDVLTFESTIVYGSNQRYHDLLSFLKSNQLSNAAPYAQVQKEIDIREFIDYQCLQIFINNQDWPGNNIKFWRAHAPGSRWRWLLYDTDFGFGIWDFSPSDNTVSFAMEANNSGWPNPSWSTYLLRSMMSNPTFKELFLQRFITHLNFTFQPDRVRGILDSVAVGIEPEINRHSARWNGPGYFAWKYQIDEMEAFAQSRPDYVRDHLRQYFNKGKVIPLHLDQPDSLLGTVWENDIQLPVHYQGLYLEKLPVPWEAQPAKGLQFTQWKIYDQPPGVPGRRPVQLSGKRIWNGQNEQEHWVEPEFRPLDLMIAQAFLPDSGAEGTPYIDLYNPFPEPLVIGGYRLTGRVQTLFPPGLTIPAGQGLRLTPDPEDYPGQRTYSLAFSLPMEGLSLGLFHPSGELIDSVSYSFSGWPLAAHISLRHPQLNNAYGENWVAKSEAEAEAYHFDPLAGKVLLNELCSDPVEGFASETGKVADWLELYNPNGYAINLAGWYLSDDSTDRFRYQIPAHQPMKTTIPAYGHLRFWADGDSLAGPLHLPFRLNKAGETLLLTEPGGWLADQVELLPLGPDESYGRFPDGGAGWVVTPLQAMTPGGPNVAANLPPVFVSEPLTEIEPGQYFQYMVQTDDPEGNYRWLEALALPRWAAFENFQRGNGQVRGTPSGADIGMHLFQFRVWDGYHKSESFQTFTVEVLDPAIEDVKERDLYQGILFPNPTTQGSSYLCRAEENTSLTFSLYDPSGRRLWTQTRETHAEIFRLELDFSVFARGMYVLQVQRGGKLVDVQKVILQ